MSGNLPGEVLLHVVPAVLLLLLDVGQGALLIPGQISQGLVAQSEQPPQELSLVLSICQLTLKL